MVNQIRQMMDQTSTAELLGRIDERTKNTVTALSALDIKLDGYGERLSKVESSLESFAPVKKVVFAAIGLILTATLVALIAVVMSTPSVNKNYQQVEVPK